MTQKTYLYDGVFVHYDGYHVVLTTDGNMIYMDSNVISGLFDYLQKIYGVTIKIEHQKAEAKGGES